MRIIAGQFRGRPLQAPAGVATRPTADRVRESLFSMLASRIGPFEDLRVADLFAGSGALGFEALSRGAGHATFVDSDRSAAAAIKANAEKLGIAERTRILGASALSLPRAEPFDLIFADPPYAPGSGTAVADAITRAEWLGEAGWLALETERSDRVDAPGLSLELERDIGRARITLLRRP